ncbi:amidohydrolase family protein [Raineyella sp. LH-20]|uniref:amidohydrolase family protein n=1 Tax=Raineyella sp. LH-20 TaxID=3081204 RepID=UPI002953E62F|nr:amidohydrolase family protein [Raineyella sp. LH-20]WOP18420.1 amidohydrolase family protein [Raineyella sp. LH-20]
MTDSAAADHRPPQAHPQGPRPHVHSHDGGIPHIHSHPHGRVPALDLSGPAPDLHLHGVLLPGDEPVDLWISGGRFVAGPLTGAQTVARDCWILPGLVDAHCHVGLDSHGAVDHETSRRQALTDRDAGTLLIRDAGSPADTRWADDREDLPRIIRAGRHIARPKRYIRNFAEEIDPEDLVGAVEQQVACGDGWVKLVGDWIDRSTGDLAPLWPAQVAAEAIARAHQLGARVTAHCFAEQSVVDLVEAGIDGIEHGTGITDDVVELMAENQVALVPTMVNLETFPQIAAGGEAKFPTYAAHMRDLHARRFATIGAAKDAGVPIYAGTDAGGSLPHGLIGQEIALLAKVGGIEWALGAASWRGRDWLEVPGVELGASADVVVYDTDPRRDAGAVRHPRLVVLRGRPYSGERDA